MPYKNPRKQREAVNEAKKRYRKKWVTWRKKFEVILLTAIESYSTEHPFYLYVDPNAEGMYATSRRFEILDRNTIRFKCIPEFPGKRDKEPES